VRAREPKEHRVTSSAARSLSPKSSDAELLTAVRAGDDDALGWLLARHAPAVLRFATKMCRNGADADDVMQETLWAAARGLKDLRGESAVSTWLYAVARSHCIKRRRRSKHAPEQLVALDAHDAMELPSATGAPDEAASRRELGTALERAIASLDEDAREVLVLRDAEGLSAAEVAAVVGTSVDAVKSRLHRARAALREQLAPLASDSAPSVPSDPACPDIVDVLSRHLEGDIGPDACAAMERHVETCTSCSNACGSLRRSLALCQSTRNGELTPEARERIRRAIDAIVRQARST
jgi:RNA polymerase sigma-70 factor (ECF subfamily)